MNQVLFPIYSLHQHTGQGNGQKFDHQVQTLPQVQGGTQNDPVFDLVLIIQPYNECCFVTW
jgi:hypothetical protein